MDYASVMPDVSRAIRRGDPSDAYFLLRSVIPAGDAGRALLALIRTDSEWAEKVRRWRPKQPPPESRRVEAALRDVDLAYVLDHPEESPLTPRETATLFLIAEGLENSEIAEVLGVATSTINQRVANVLKALHAPNRANAVMIGLRRGIIA